MSQHVKPLVIIRNCTYGVLVFECIGVLFYELGESSHAAHPQEEH